MPGEMEDKVEPKAEPQPPEGSSKAEEVAAEAKPAAKEEEAAEEKGTEVCDAADDKEEEKDGAEENKADGKEDEEPEDEKPAKAKHGRAAAGRTPQKAKAAGSRTSARARKAVDHFVVEALRGPSEVAVVKEGKGEKLSDIPNIVFHMSKVSGKDDLMNLLHRLLYGRPGKANTRKRDILAFSGFVYEDKELEQEKDLDKVMKWKLEEIHRVMDLLDMQRGTGSKEEKATRLLEFLEKPCALSDKDLAAKAEKKKAAAKRKRELAAKKEKTNAAKAKVAAKKTVAANKKTPVSKKKAPEPEDEEEEEKEEEEEEEEVKPAKKKAKPAKSPKAVPPEQTQEEKEIADAAIGIMKTVDLKEFSLKNLMAQLQDNFGKSMGPFKTMLKKVAVDYVTKHS
mmetsp:Transcript_31519/g.89480  ORF Transcript_31519/g.89480 Transcript_31519/m.89480 type:complete len:396 (+) Transcript_31519:133-1320(+)|eukprot:CAMPEP_0117674000 /NCGR_PEP_ID=MMETSP0804-20121206/14791_1 /TAXON_ID=1074897 /ORGANISM="Tetraselmis astigmatica, Strain CCMP880" /LENGTH=395 /DNA_ID=CAMNT_0005482813 /DNA_START=96 /DNA_END=1283 /DNA_ORIENTATION=+